MRTSVFFKFALFVLALFFVIGACFFFFWFGNFTFFAAAGSSASPEARLAEVSTIGLGNETALTPIIRTDVESISPQQVHPEQHISIASNMIEGLVPQITPGIPRGINHPRTINAQLS